MKRLLSLLLLGGLTVAALTGCAGGKHENTATIRFHFSRFESGVITAHVGVPFTFTLQNDDPIEHEWIVGTDAVHDRHRTGTEPFHNQVPTEMTVPSLSTRTTTVTFEAPGQYAFICHLPGHEAYGMRGTVLVVAN